MVTAQSRLASSCMHNTRLSRYCTDDAYMTDASFQQLIFIDQHSTPPESDVPSATQKLMFSSSMSDEDFFKWLRSKGVSDKDCKILSGKYTILSDTYS